MKLLNIYLFFLLLSLILAYFFFPCCPDKALMVRLQAHPFTVCGRWQADMIHSAWCRVMRFPLSPSLSILSPLFSSPNFHPSITSSSLSFHPFLLTFSPHFFRGAPVSITQPVSSRDRIWVIGAGECARVLVCVCVCGQKTLPSRQTELPFPLPPNEVWLVSCGEPDRQLQPPSSDTHLPVTLDLLPTALLSQSIAVRDPSLSC